MSAFPRQLILRLDPLIRRLASEFEGERLECLRALERTLKNNGVNFHDLADALAAAPGGSSREPTPEPETADDVMLAALQRCSTLNDWERNFVDSLQRWRKARQPFTPKQRATLQGLFARRGGFQR